MRCDFKVSEVSKCNSAKSDALTEAFSIPSLDGTKISDGAENVSFNHPAIQTLDEIVLVINYGPAYQNEHYGRLLLIYILVMEAPALFRCEEQFLQVKTGLTLYICSVSYYEGSASRYYYTPPALAPIQKAIQAGSQATHGPVRRHKNEATGELKTAVPVRNIVSPELQVQLPAATTTACCDAPSPLRIRAENCKQLDVGYVATKRPCLPCALRDN